MNFEPGQQVGRYVLEDRIGEGGMGSVWRARHALLRNRIVAIKVMHEELRRGESFTQRFEKEAERQAMLNHPGIVPVVDFFEENGRQCLVMNYIPGQSLEDRLHARASLPVAEASAIAGQVLHALEFAHQHGVIHRDLKPSNILLGSDGQAYLTDFGIAIAVGERRFTRTGEAVGTVEYLSPEQILTPSRIDFRADVYSFGCVLYEMLTGRPPFLVDDPEGDTMFQLKQKHVNERPEPPGVHNRALSKKVDAVVLMALEKNPEDRFPGCGSFREALLEAAEEPDSRRDRAPTAIDDRSTQPPPLPATPPARPAVKPVSRGGYIFGWLVLNASGFALATYAGQSGASGDESLAIFLATSAIAFLLTVMRLLHKAWAAIHDGASGVSPGPAVGLLFVPIVNLFWSFRVFPGYVTAFRKFGERQRLQLPKLSWFGYLLFLLNYLSWPVLAGVDQGAGLFAGAFLLQAGLGVPLMLNSLGKAVNAVARAPR